MTLCKNFHTLLNQKTTTMQVPKEVAVVVICLMLYLIFRDDLAPALRERFPKKKKTLREIGPVSDEEFINQQRLLEQKQIPEYN
jgi:hypothetical protein